ncbi:MAG: GNAT family N-acetyltransferase, partial [Bacteroidota bacterium]
LLPLPWNRKLLGYRQIYPPYFTQQLGVFGPAANGEVFTRMLRKIPHTFRRVHLACNHHHTPQPHLPGTWSTKRNLLLNLTQDYAQIWSGYDKSLRRRLRKAKSRLQLIALDQPSHVVSLYRTQLESRLKLGPAAYQRMEQLMQAALLKRKGQLWGIKEQASDKLCCGGFFLLSADRIVNLFGASTPEGRKLHAMHFLLDALIERYSDKLNWFDFEGSEVPAIARFFASYGAIEQSYSHYFWDRSPKWVWAVEKMRRSIKP